MRNYPKYYGRKKLNSEGTQRHGMPSHGSY